MIVYPTSKINPQHTFRGKGLFSKVITSLPFELHIPGYQYCGPSTKLQKRMLRGDQGVNPLDAACKVHDIAYSQNKDIKQLHQADKELSERAWERVLAKDSSIGEKIASYFVTNAMKAKVKLGMGMKKRKGVKKNKKKKNKKRSKSPCGKKLFANAVKNASRILKKQKNSEDVNAAIKIAHGFIKKSFKGKKSKVVIPRVITVPKFGGKLGKKFGGVIGLIPIFSALSALGAIASGASGIFKTLSSAKNAKHQLEEAARHNNKMESIAVGKGLYLKPYKKGYGIGYAKNDSKNS